MNFLVSDNRQYLLPIHMSEILEISKKSISKTCNFDFTSTHPPMNLAFPTSKDELYITTYAIGMLGHGYV